MYNNALLLDFIATLNLPEIWAKRATHAASTGNDILIWNAIERGLSIPHDGTVLEILKPFEK